MTSTLQCLTVLYRLQYPYLRGDALDHKYSNQALFFLSLYCTVLVL